MTLEYCLHKNSECNDTDVRLVQLDGDMENEGRVEFCSGGQWGQLCYDSWDSNDAEVVCRQLGYNVEGKSNEFTKPAMSYGN